MQVKTVRAKNGRSYAVVPLTMIVPGVLNGSNGAILYTPGEVARSARKWDGVPITVGHPMDDDGWPQSASNPAVGRLGVVRKPAITRKGNLVGEGWFDIATTNKLAPGLLAMIYAGRRIEVSTGLDVDQIPARFGATYGGVPYTHTGANYRPDHLAVLLDQQGACSVRDGCGLNANCYRPRSSATTRESRERYARSLEALGLVPLVNERGELYYPDDDDKATGCACGCSAGNQCSEDDVLAVPDGTDDLTASVLERRADDRARRERCRGW